MPSFLQPLGLLALLAVIPVIALYVLRARRRRVRVGSTLLWEVARREVLARSPWRRLQPERSLLLELLAVVAVALALAAPVHRASRASTSVALVLDVSASMGASSRSGSRLDEARSEALRRLSRLDPDARVMVVAAGRRPRVVFPLGGDRRRAEAALRELAPTDEEGSLGASIAFAADHLRLLSGDRRAVVITDGALAHPPPTVPTDPTVEVVRVGSPSPNRAIVRSDARVGRTGAGPEQVQVTALVANFSAAPTTAVVAVRRDGDGAELARESVTLGPRERRPVSLQFPFDARDVGRGLTVSLLGGDVLATDDLAFTRVPPGAQMPVVLVGTSPDPWLRRALSADPEVRLQVGPPESVATAPPEALRIYDGVCPVTDDGSDAVVLAPPQGDCLGVEVGATVDAPRITSFPSDDPRFRFLSLDGVHLARSRALRPRSSGSEILRAQGTVLGLALGDASHAITMLGFVPADSDWPLRASFVVFVRNVVELARLHRSRAVQTGGRVGEPLRVPLPSSVRGLHATGPGGSVPVVLQGGAGLIADTSRAGVYRLAWDGGSTSLPVNLYSDAESDLARTPWSPRADEPVTPVGARRYETADLAPWCALLGALCLLADLLWLSRRPRAQGVSA